MLNILFAALLLLLGTLPVRGADGVKLVDVTAESGLTFHHHSSPEKKYLVEVMAGGAAFLDYDNDGWLDIYLVNSLTVDSAHQPNTAESHLYRSNHDGTFTNVTAGSGLAYPGWGMGVVAADFDSDGWTDLYVTCLGPNRLFRNNGDGSFTDIGTEAGVADPRWSIGAAFGDYDLDGDLDLFVSNYVDFSLDNLPEFGEGKWCQHRGIPVHCGPRGLKGAGDSLFRNEGGGKFSDVSVELGVYDSDERYGLGVVWSDLNDDGYPDIFAVNDTGANYMYMNREGKHFEDQALLSGIAVNEAGMAQGCMGIAVGDYDHDQRLDFYVTNFGDEYNVLYKRDASGFFFDSSFSSLTTQASLPNVGWGTAFLDYDNDGWVDVFAVNGHVYPQVEFADVGSRYAQPKMLLHNQKDGTFSDVSKDVGPALQERRVSRGAAFGDYDNDGDVDIIVNDLDGPPMLLRNDGGNQGNWIRIDAEGSGKNRLAIGAKVTVSAGGLVQLSQVMSGGSYASQSDFRQHFGLGEATLVDWVSIEWPDGTSTRVEKIPVNQTIKIRQAAGGLAAE